MTPPTDHDSPVPVPAACVPTVDRIQAVLDGLVPPDTLTVDPHTGACTSCRERVRAARLLATAFAEPAPPVDVPPAFANAILAGVRADRRARSRRRVLALTAGLATAAAVVVAVWASLGSPDRRPSSAVRPPELVERTPTPAPPAPTPEPAVQPIRLNDELVKAGDALRDSSRSLAEPASSAPKVFAALTDSLLKTTPVPAPEAPGQVGQSLVELPEAAKIGLEPVTGSAQKAFTRLMRDVGAIQPKTKS